MSERTLKAILGVVAALVVVWGIVALVSRGGASPASRDGGTLARALDGLDAESLEAVRLRGPGDTVELLRGSGGWTANGFAADSAAVARMVRALEEARAGDVVATNPANHERLGVTPGEAWTVELVGVDGTTTTVLLGSTGPRFATAYARMPDEDEVRLLSADLRGALARPLVDWRDKVVARVDTAAVGAVVVERDGSRYALVRGEAGWTVADDPGAPGPDLATDGAIRDLLTELADLRAFGFAPDTAAIPEEDRRTAVVLGTAGDTLAAIEMGGGEGAMRARATGLGTVYELARWRADRLAPTRERARGGEGSAS